jgi:hypothetical protein
VANRTPLTGVPLEQPDPDPLCVNALLPAHRNEPCVTHAVHFKGRMPCTGPLVCSMCGTEWNPDTGRLLAVPGRGKTDRDDS